MSVPPELLLNNSLEGHFELVHHQLKQIRFAMALSWKLNRVLVMPELTCLYDRFWFPLNHGRNEAAEGPAIGPFVCPLGK